VAITPGRDFGDAGAARHVRFTYTVDRTVLAEVVRRLRATLAA
jgi:aspartate/methionine/tyrosine aminotransferase